MQINSLGYLLGDEGSGYALGRSFLKKYLRSELSDNIIKSFENEYKISKENFRFVRPGVGIPANSDKSIVGRKLNKKLGKGNPITWDDLE